MSEAIRIGIIGGSGLYDMAELTDRKELAVSTPYGDPSAPLVLATLRGRRVAFLARHGHGHRFTPSELNYRANIYAMKSIGVEWILSASAVGSLREDYKPLDLVIPTQFFDRTRGRASTFFGDGLVGHVAFAHPFCGPLSSIAFDSAIVENCGPSMQTYVPDLCTVAPALRADSHAIADSGPQNGCANATCPTSPSPKNVLARPRVRSKNCVGMTRSSGL
jgi:5'-methylthioadenosine phosphorylase